jgi:hypothetical protein
VLVTIVEQKLETHAEPIAVTCHQVRTQRVLVDAELVEGAVEPRVVDQARVHAEQIVEGRGVIPMLGHAQFRALRAEPRDGEQRRHVRPRDRLAAGGQEAREQLVELESVPERETEVALAEIARALDAQPADVGAFPLPRSASAGASARAESRTRSQLQAGQLGGPRGGRARGASPRSSDRSSRPSRRAAPSTSAAIQLPERSDDPLARTPRRAHRLAQVPVAVTDAARRFLVLRRRNMPGRIAGIRRHPNNGVFGTTSSPKRTPPSLAQSFTENRLSSETFFADPPN